MSEFNPEHLPEVKGPNNRPRPHEFDTNQVIYGDGLPDVPEPEWMKDEAERMQKERDEQATDELERLESARSRRFMSAIYSDIFWYGEVTDGDYRDRQNGIRPPFEP